MSGLESGKPRAIIHKRILDIAEANPDAPLEEIAEEATGATTDLVSRVLQKYGDSNGEIDNIPDEEGSLDDLNNQGKTMADTDDEKRNEKTGKNREQNQITNKTGAIEIPSRSELSEKQMDVLHSIKKNPNATQRELAEKLDVTAPTISRRLNDISEFAWDQRDAFVSRLFDGDGIERGSQNGDTGNDDEDEIRSQIKNLRGRVETLEQQTEDSLGEDRESGLDIEILHKMIHACMASENITEEEELQIIDELIGDKK